MKEKKPSLKMLITYAGMQFKGTSPAGPSQLHLLNMANLKILIKGVRFFDGHLARMPHGIV